MDNQFKNNEEFKDCYLDVLKARLTMASLDLEGVNTDYASSVQTKNMMAQYYALKVALDHKDDFYDNTKFLGYIEQIVKLITFDDVCKIRIKPIEVNGSNVKRAMPYNICQELFNAIENYKYQRNLYLEKTNNHNVIDQITMENDLFSYEAQLHINFLRIHPFEDGNGRTARIILAANLLNNDHAPSIITKETKTEYCKYIENNDINGMAKLLKDLSSQEKMNIESSYNNFVVNNNAPTSDEGIKLVLKKTE